MCRYLSSVEDHARDESSYLDVPDYVFSRPKQSQAVMMKHSCNCCCGCADKKIVYMHKFAQKRKYCMSCCVAGQWKAYDEAMMSIISRLVQPLLGRQTVGNKTAWPRITNIMNAQFFLGPPGSGRLVDLFVCFHRTGRIGTPLI